MAAIAPVALAGSAAASDLLRSSTPGLFFGGGFRIGVGSSRREVRVMAKMRRVKKKKERPWPANPDPNVKGGVGSYLSSFKPLKERPKPAVLAFEKPLVDLEKKIQDVKRMAADTNLDFAEQIEELEMNYQKALEHLYRHLTPIQRVNIARHPNRPTFLDHIFTMTEKFIELHGDRGGYDDPAIVCGLGSIDGRTYMFIGQQKGRNSKENIKRNFGMPTPHGYRKALRFMRYADHHGFPIVTFVDTPGAFADLKSEHLGQGEAIAVNLREMFTLKVPVVSIVMGEGGSGGALAIACGNFLFMLENACFYVASPEACAAILWKTAKASPKAAKKLRITAVELCKQQIADGVIPEPLGGAHKDPEWTSLQIRKAITKATDELLEMSVEELKEHRYQKFRKIGTLDTQISHGEGNSKEKAPESAPFYQLKSDLENLVEEICKSGGVTVKTLESSKDSSVKALESSRYSAAKTPGYRRVHLNLFQIEDPRVNKLIEKLKKEIQLELAEALEKVGLKDTFRDFQHLQLGRLKTELGLQPADPGLSDKEIKRVKDTLDKGLQDASNNRSLNYKLDMLAQLTGVKSVNEKSISKKRSIMDNISLTLGWCNVLQCKAGGGKISEETLSVLHRSYLAAHEGLLMRERDGKNALPSLKAELESLAEEISKKMVDLVDLSDFKNMIEQVNSERTGTRNVFGENQISDQYDLRLKAALDSPGIKEKYEKLKRQFAETLPPKKDRKPNVEKEKDFGPANESSEKEKDFRPANEGSEKEKDFRPATANERSEKEKDFRPANESSEKEKDFRPANESSENEKDFRPANESSHADTRIGVNVSANKGSP